MHLMFVCRRFREVGLAQIELWCYISMPMRHLSTMDAFESYKIRIDRAKGWPLSIRFIYNSELVNVLDIDKLALWQSANFKKLIISRDRRNSKGLDFGGFLERLASKEYPVLHSLTMNAASFGVPHAHAIHRLLSSEVTPALQTLSLGFVPKEVWTDLSCLTDFDLWPSLPDQDVVVNTMNLLGRCPSLRTLKVTELLRHVRGVDLTCPPDQTLLLSLQNMTHIGELPLANAILNSASVPNARVLIIILTGMGCRSITELKQLAANVKKYLLGSPAAAQSVHVLEVNLRTFITYAHRDCQEMSMSITTSELPPEINTERLFCTLFPAFLYAAPIACLDI